MKRLIVGLAGLLVVSLAATNAFSDVQVAIDSGNLWVHADDGVGGGTTQTIAATMPLSTTHSATDGTATSTATYNFSNSGETAVFDISSITQSFGVGDQYLQALGNIDFTLSETVDYSIAGAFSGSGTDSDDEYYEYVLLYDYSASAFASNEFDYVVGTSASLALDGVVQGDGYTEGSLTGTLSPGQYLFLYSTQIRDFDADRSGSADASGYASLTLSKVIPEPSTLAMLSVLVALGIAMGWYRRRKA